MIKVGDWVRYQGEDSDYSGVVVSVFKKLDGKQTRVVVQDERGLLLIKGVNPSDHKECSD